MRLELCEEAIRLAGTLPDLLPQEPDVSGLLALLLLVDARRPGRIDDAGDLVLLEDQDRSCWHHAKIAEAAALVERALRAGLALFDALAGNPRAVGWPPLHVARADLLGPTWSKLGSS